MKHLLFLYTFTLLQLFIVGCSRIENPKDNIIGIWSGRIMGHPVRLVFDNNNYLEIMLPNEGISKYHRYKFIANDKILIDNPIDTLVIEQISEHKLVFFDDPKKSESQKNIIVRSKFNKVSDL